jgi:23S rRNA (pseudouridine1915-N3)-methyltransferase
MIIRIIAVGKIRERYWQDALSDYERRLRPYARLEVAEVPEARIPEGASAAQERISLDQEAESILGRMKGHSGPVIVLDRQGRTLDSLELAAWLEVQLLEGQKETQWVIGGPRGLAGTVLKRADLILSISRMTFPHQMMRLILLEQIYRGFRIMHHEPYHK